MPYGTIKVDNITFTNGGSDTTITVSGLAASTTGNLTVTGTISGAVVRATTVSGVTVTGTTVQGASGTFTSITGGVATITSGVFAAGSAAAPSISFTSDANTGIYSPGADQVAISTNGTVRLYIDSLGNVGVGNSAQSDAGYGGFTVNGASGSIITLRAGGSNSGRIYTTGTDNINIDANGTASTNILFRTGTGSTERMRITSAGLVGIGTSSPSYILETSQPGTGGVVVGASLAASGNGGSGRGTGLLFKAPGSSSAVEVARIDGRQNTASATANDATLNFMVADSGGTLQERLTITNAGRVGIGSTAPTNSLEVVGGATSNLLAVKASSSGDCLAVTARSAGNGAIVSALNSAQSDYEPLELNGEFIYFQTRTGAGTTSERARIDSSGRLLVGTSTARDPNGEAKIESFNGPIAVSTFANSPGFYGLNFIKSRGTSTNVVVQNNDSLSAVRFFAADGTSFIEGARIEAFVDGTPGTNDMPGRLVFSTTSDGASSPTERLRITSAGLVGIGTSAPDRLLHLSSTTYPQLRMVYPGQQTWDTGVESTGFYTVARAGQTAAITVDTSNRVGIGTTSPAAPLHVAGDIRSGVPGTNGSITLNRASDGLPINAISYDSGTEEMRINNGSGNGRIVFQTISTERARIDSSGRLLVGTSSALGNITRFTENTTPSVQLVSNATGSWSNGTAIINYSAAGYAGVLSLGMSKSNTVGTNALVASGDRVGVISFNGNDGAVFAEAVRIDALVDGTPGANDMPGRLVFSVSQDGSASPTERVRLRNTGSLHVFNGDVGIRSISSAAAGTTVSIFRGSHSGFGAGTGAEIGTESIYIWSNGNVQNTNNSYGAISDIKLKENIVDAASQWDDIKALQVRKYNFKEGQTHTQIGLVAQEVELVSPGLVSESPDRDAEGNDLGTVTKSVNYSVLYMKAVKALQEAIERIETLEAKVAALEGA